MAERKPRLITRQQPHIETLQVSVQVVRIGPKQMTQAVFRQLQNVDLVDLKTMELRGVPWGTVHYKPGDCAPHLPGTHLHVIWQLGDALRRGCFPLQHPQARACTDKMNSSLWRHRRGAYLLALLDILESKDRLCTGAIQWSTYRWPVDAPAPMRPYNVTLQDIEKATYTERLTQEVVRIEIQAASEVTHPILHIWRNLETYIDWCVKTIGEQLGLPPAERNARDPLQREMAQAVRDYTAVHRQLQALTARWQEHVEEIEALPQLFIAV